MRKNSQRFLFLISSLAILVILSSQLEKNNAGPDRSLPAPLLKRLDSLRNADSLAEWLYTYRAYVYQDPAKRIAILAKAQAGAWRLCRDDREREEWINGLAAQGYYLLYSGNILASIDAYEQAYRFYFNKPIPGFDVLEYVLKPLGNNYTRLGDYDRAFFIQEKSLALAEEKDSSQIAPICHNLATTAIWKEDLVLAKQYCEKGLDKVKKNSAFHGLLLSTLAEIFLKSGNIPAAGKNITEAISILTPYLSGKEEVNAAYWLRGAWQGKGDIEKEKQQPALALGSYKKAIDIVDHYYKGERKREKAQLLVSLGQVLLQLHEPQKAIDQYDAALTMMIPSFKPATIEDLPGAAELYGENTLSDALHGKAECLTALNKKETALLCYLLLYITDRKLRHEFFSAAAKQQQQKESRQWTESAMNTAYELWAGSGKNEYAEKVLLIAEMSKAQLLLDEMRSNLRYSNMKNHDTLLLKKEELTRAVNYYEKEIAMNSAGNNIDSSAALAKKELEFELSLIQKQVNEKFSRKTMLMADGELPSVQSMLQKIPANTTVVEFFVGNKSIYIIEAVKGAVQHIRKLDSAALIQSDVNNFVHTFFQQGPANMMNRPQDYYKNAYALYHRLWQDSITGVQQQCMIIPDGVFGYLPFDALLTDSTYKVDPGQWPYLIRQYNIYQGYSLQTAQQEMKGDASSFAGFFVSFDSSISSSIPAVKKEYDEIHAVTQGNFYRDKEATISAFNKSLGDVNILHISTHSFLQGKENIPVLQLADSSFFLFELYGKLFRPQLVVLSACRTGHGMLAEGEGIISLARGFMASGAAGIVAGLWNMNDEATAVMMGSFYRHLITDQLPANALHASKLKWLQAPGQALQKLPYFWAGMVYSGANDPVIIRQKNTGRKQWWIPALVVFLLLIIVLFTQKVVLRK
jgi:CHAT domain-containing protein